MPWIDTSTSVCLPAAYIDTWDYWQSLGIYFAIVIFHCGEDYFIYINSKNIDARTYVRSDSFCNVNQRFLKFLRLLVHGIEILEMGTRLKIIILTYLYLTETKLVWHGVQQKITLINHKKLDASIFNNWCLELFTHVCWIYNYIAILKFYDILKFLLFVLHRSWVLWVRFVLNVIFIQRYCLVHCVFKVVAVPRIDTAFLIG